MSRSINRQASEWFARRSEGVPSAAEEAAFEAWYGADRRHAEAYDALLSGIARVRRLRGEVDTEALLAPSRRRMLKGSWAAGATAIAASGVGAIFLLREDVAQIEAFNAPRTDVLADGSLMEINAGALVETHFSRTTHLVRVERGEAIFDVEPRFGRLFEVLVDGLKFRSEGGLFAVALTTLGPRLIVTSGVVGVSALRDGALSSMRVSAGQCLELIGGEAKIAHVSHGEIARLLGWRRTTLNVANEPLADVVREMERHTNARFSFADPTLEVLAVQVYVRVMDLDAFVLALETTYPM
ncbi:MAG TPA: DUF4880 domain-containing protein, partial [Verrucomicrobiae bacterium]|nr:DUF4880 domain-containing protein [Verrucomicrobiae bacterium]